MSASDPVGTGALLWTTRRLMNDCREKQTYFSAEIKTLESSLKGVRAAGGLAGTWPKESSLLRPRSLPACVTPSQIGLSVNMTAQRVNLSKSATGVATLVKLKAAQAAGIVKLGVLQTSLDAEVSSRCSRTTSPLRFSHTRAPLPRGAVLSLC